MPEKIIERLLAPEVKRLSATYKVLTVFGPRQTGKSTLVKNVFPDYDFVNLEDSSLQREAEEDPKGFLINHASPLIIDEIQRVPALVSQIQANVDEKDSKGQYIITGSYQKKVKKTVAQSLATRTATVHLLPFSFVELENAGLSLPRNEQMFTGFMPNIYSTQGIVPSEYYSYYRSVHLDKDIREERSFADVRLFHTFLEVLAGRAAQTLVNTAIAGEVGVSSMTIKEWLSLLENAYIIYFLPPWSKNLTSRAVKSPKMYFTETGLLVSMARISSPKEIGITSLTGAIFENMVVMEALKARYNSCSEPNLYFYRDNNGVEVDLILEKGIREVELFEIKAAYSISKDFARNLNRFENLHPGYKVGKNIIYSGETLLEPVHGVRYINYKDIAPFFAEKEKYVPVFTTKE